METPPPLTRLLLIRHGDSVHKVEGVTGGPRSCKGLTLTGRQQAEKLRDRLARDTVLTAAPIRLYSSWLPRAVETAQILAGAFGDIAVEQDAALVSWTVLPERDGMTYEEYGRQYSLTGGGVFRPFQDGNESWAELVVRAGRALTNIVQRHPGETILVVAHTEVVGASLIVFGHLPLYRPFDVHVANASLTEWTTAEDPAAFPPARWTLMRFNDAAHLEKTASDQP